MRFALAFIVGVLALSASGVSDLAINEPCSPFELPGHDDGTCPPICVTCGCCAQAVEPVALMIAAAPEILVSEIATVLLDLPPTDPHDILHVPKLRLS